MSDIEDLQADIEKTREQLGETVEALSAKLDVKAHVKSSAEHTKDRAVASVSSNWPVLVGFATAAIVAAIIWKKR